MNFLKTLYVLIGGISLGFGTGVMVVENMIIQSDYYWLITSLCLVVSGFFLALGFMLKSESPAKEEVKPEETVQEDKN